MAATAFNLLVGLFFVVALVIPVALVVGAVVVVILIRRRSTVGPAASREPGTARAPLSRAGHGGVREIVINGSGWRTPEDFYTGLLPVLGAPEWHGHSLDALNDSIGGGGINRVNPPFRIRISGTDGMTEEARVMVARFADLIHDLKAVDVDVELVCEPG